MDMSAYVKKLLVDLVEYPDSLKVVALAGVKTRVFEIRCHASDAGKLIGRSGKTISAVRTLVSQVASRQGFRALVEIAE